MKLPPTHYPATFDGATFTSLRGYMHVKNKTPNAFVVISKSAFDRLVRLAKQAQHTNRALEQEDPTKLNPYVVRDRGTLIQSPMKEDVK